MDQEHRTRVKFNVWTVRVKMDDVNGRIGHTWHGFLFFCGFYQWYKLCYGCMTPNGAFRFESCLETSMGQIEEQAHCTMTIMAEVTKRLYMDHWLEVERILEASLHKQQWDIGEYGEHWAAQAYFDIMNLYGFPPGQWPRVSLRESFANDNVAKYISGLLPPPPNDS